MKGDENKYLSKLFTVQSDDGDATEIQFPLVDVPSHVSDKLYSISQSTHVNTDNKGLRSFVSWPKFASVAATVLMAVVLVQNHQQQQTIKQLEQAQTDLATALRYLGEANQIARIHTLNTLNQNIKKAGLAPVLEIGREAASPTVDSLESATNRSQRRL